MEIVHAKNLPETIELKSKQKKKFELDKNIKDAKKGFKAKKFQNLNNTEKDELLQLVAMQLGIIDE